MPYILTIDDGPTKDAKAKLDFLNQQGIKAIWFCIGKNLEQRPDVALDMIRTGHIIANHSYSHPHFSDLDYLKASREIVRTDEIISELYHTAITEQPMKLFRFPYGDQGDGETHKQPERRVFREQLTHLLQRLNYTPINNTVEFYGSYHTAPGDHDWLWSYDVREWAINADSKFQLTYEQVQANLQTYLGNHNKNKDQVILIHDHEHTSHYFNELIGALNNRDISFKLPVH